MIPVKPSAKPHGSRTHCVFFFFCHKSIPSHPKAREALSRQKAMRSKWMSILILPFSYLRAQKPPCCAVDSDDVMITVNTLRGIQGPHNLYSTCITQPTLCPPTCYSQNMPFSLPLCLCSCCSLLLPFNSHQPKSYLSSQAQFTSYLHQESFFRPKLSNRVATHGMCYFS